MTVPQSDPPGGGEQRPRPQYGEYASPEEQRARIAQPAPPVVAPPRTPSPAPVPPASTAVPRRAGAHPVDRIATIALLAYGAVNVLFSAFSYLDLPAVAAQVYRIMGVSGEFTNVDAARTWGIAAAVVLVVGYAVTALLAVRTLRRGRISWWIPLVGAVATYLVVYVCIAVPLIGDPAFSQYVTSR